MSDFTFEPAPWIPFRDKEVIERVRNIKREDITKHPNKNFNIIVEPDNMVEFNFVMDMFYRIKAARDAGEKIVIIMPNPCHAYAKVAALINRFGVNCDHLHAFAMDEWADQDGKVAPESYPQGFGHALKKWFYNKIDENLRPPEKQITLFTNENIDNYSKMLADMGGADACYSGSGWAGHIAFVDPDSPELAADSLDEWKQLSARVVTLHPLTIAQNSLHGSFGMCGDLTFVPPRAATIGPADVCGSKYVRDTNALATAGTKVSWQRFTSRLVAHGPVTPQVPSSLVQTLNTDFIISESHAANIEPDWDFEY